MRAHPLLCLTLLAFVTGCALHRPAGRPWPDAIREYVLPNTGAFPSDIVVGADGAVWYTDRTRSRIGRLNPETGEVRETATPTPRSAPYDIALAPDGGVWYAASRSGLLGRLDPETGEIREYPIPGATGGPHSLVVRGDRIWFTLRRGHGYGWLNPGTGEAKIFPFEAAGRGYQERGPYALAESPDGTLWFTAMTHAALFRVDPGSGALTAVPLPAGGWARRLAVDRRGRVWYTNFPRGRLGMMEPRTGRVTEIPLLRAPAEPYGIEVGPDGRVWFNESRNRLLVGYDPRSERFHSIPIPTQGGTIRGMAVDHARRRLWLPLSGTHRIGRVDLP
jgi:virginiamycin B lyase